MCFLGKSWQGPLTKESCLVLIWKWYCILILHQFDWNVFCSLETVIDNSDSAIVASMWVKRNIGRLLTYDFIFCQTGFLPWKLGSTWLIIQFWDISFQWEDLCVSCSGTIPVVWLLLVSNFSLLNVLHRDLTWMECNRIMNPLNNALNFSTNQVDALCIGRSAEGVSELLTFLSKT